MQILSLIFAVSTIVGLIALIAQRIALSVALRRGRRRLNAAMPDASTGISVLKPLCGIDDQLQENLECFAALEHPNVEVLLGVKDTRDSAYPLACAAASRWPGRFRVVLQEGSPGLNPKVNQLITLTRHARHSLYVVSDSNVRVSKDYLHELEHIFHAQLVVGCVTNPVSGTAHRSFGALLDNLHLASSIGAGQLAAKQLANKDLVVGKSLAIRRDVLEQLGGWQRYADVLAEDYVIGRDVRTAGWNIAVAVTPVLNVAEHRTVKSFWQRYLRWGVIHRTAVSLPTSLSQALLNPIPLALLALVVHPSGLTAALTLSTVFLKVVLDASSARALDCEVPATMLLPAVLVKDALIFITWCNGLFSRTITWRGNRMRVGHGSRLEPAVIHREPVAAAQASVP